MIDQPDIFLNMEIDKIIMENQNPFYFQYKGSSISTHYGFSNFF